MRRVIVAGCGFAGLAIAWRLQRSGWDVLGLTHSLDSAARVEAEGVRAKAVDISDRASVERLAGKELPDLVIHCASSNLGGAEAYAAVYLRGSENLLAGLRPKHFIFTSSTSVYAQVDGSAVTEDSPAEPPRETGRILRQTEELVLAQNGAVARIAGIYGPGRSVLLRKFFAGEAVIEGDGTRIINQAHRDDIATAFEVLAERAHPGIYNVCDDSPLPQRALYEALAARFALPLPAEGPINPNRKRGWTSKRVSNGKLRALGWKPRFPSFFDAIECDPALVRLARGE